MALTQSEILYALQQNRVVVMRQADMLMQKAVAAGQSIKQVAQTVGQYFSPWYATRRAPDGTLVRDGREGAVKDWPGAAGMASAGARRLMLTEAQHRHRDGVKRKAKHDDKLMKYHLSPAHRHHDVCDELATADSGYGPGVYEPDDFPDFPHPYCTCSAKTVRRPAE
jgi:hypothetical protein